MSIIKCASRKLMQVIRRRGFFVMKISRRCGFTTRPCFLALVD